MRSVHGPGATGPALLPDPEDNGAMTGAHAWDWARMGFEAATETWADLAGWVVWLVARYDLGDEIPVCWWEHTAILEELTALWAAWLLAYQHEDSTAERPLAWHKDLGEARTRIKAWDRLGCARGTHRLGAEQPWAFDYDDDFVAHVRADVGPRRRRLVALS